jgi:hypothetical protein
MVFDVDHLIEVYLKESYFNFIKKLSDDVWNIIFEEFKKF